MMVDQRSFMWRFTARATLAFQVLATGWFAIYPTLSMAAPPTEAEIQAVMNESQWDGALLLKRQTELPSIVDSNAPPADADYFTDDTRSNFKNQIVLPDIIRGYSMEATEALRSEIAGMNAAPNTVNEKLVDKDAAFLAASYPENCNDVPLADRADCEHYNAQNAIIEGKRNRGHNLFLGAIDPIITFCRNTDFYYGPGAIADSPGFGTRPGCPYLPVTVTYTPTSSTPSTAIFPAPAPPQAACRRSGKATGCGLGACSSPCGGQCERTIWLFHRSLLLMTAVAGEHGCAIRLVRGRLGHQGVDALAPVAACAMLSTSIDARWGAFT